MVWFDLIKSEGFLKNILREDVDSGLIL